VPGITGNDSVKDRENWLGIDLDGVVGSGLFAGFRVTLVDGGRTMWLEDLPREALEQKPIDWSDDQPVDDSMYEELDKEDAKADPKAGKAKPTPAAPPANKAGAAPKPAGAKP
jgi:hypothetical protein